MKKLFTYLCQPKFLLAVILLESVAFGSVIFSMKSNIPNVAQVLAQSTDFLDEDIRACLRMPVSERPVCARHIGTKLMNHPISLSEKVDQCMKLRPLYNRYCTEALQP